MLPNKSLEYYLLLMKSVALDFANLTGNELIAIQQYSNKTASYKFMKLTKFLCVLIKNVVRKCYLITSRGRLKRQNL